MSRRFYRSTDVRRDGLTLLEMVVALSSAAVLMTAMASTMFVALRASDPSYTVAPGILETSACLADMTAELQYTIAINALNANSITVTVPDRNDADTAPETIRYSFSGSTLSRQYNGGANVEVLTGVASVTFTPYPSSTAPKTITVAIQRTAGATSTVHTGIPLINMP